MSILKNIKPVSYCVALFFIAIFLVQHLFAFTGPFGFDDLEYARLGHLLFSGQPNWTEPFMFRLGVIAPLGFFQKIFGVTDAAGAIYPFLISLLAIALVYTQVHQNWKIKFFALLLYTSCPWVIFYSDKMGADIPIMCCILLAVCILYQFRFNKSWQAKQILGGSLLAFTLFLALLTKETVWFLFPFLFLLFLYDSFRKQHIKFWLSTIFSVFLLMFFYSIWQKIQFNDWFYRFHLIKTNDITNLCSYDRQPFEVVFKRITYQLWLHLIKESSFVIPVVLLLVTLSRSFFINVFAKENFWTLAALIMILSANFWTISYSSYHPLCVDVRHYLYIMPISAIAIANHYQKLFRKWSLLTVILCCAVLLFFAQDLALKQGAILQLLILMIIFSLLLIIKNKQKNRLSLFVFLPLSILYLNIKAASAYQYPWQKEMAIRFLKDKSNVTIYAAKTQEGLFKYYLGFENPNHLKIVPYLEFNDVKKGFHYWNYHALYMSDDFYAIPPALNAFSTPKNLIYNTHVIKIYQIPNSSLKAEPYFLKSSSYWDLGKFTIKTIQLDTSDEFGPTFKMDLDAKVKSIHVASRWKLKNKTAQDAYLVFSIDENGKSLFYQAFSIATGKSAIYNPYYLDKSISINNLQIKANAELRVYIWNNLKTKLDIENARITLVKVP